MTRKYLTLLPLLTIILFCNYSYALASNEDWKSEVIHGKNGKTSIGSFEGSPVILMFYTTWCHFCKAELPKLSILYRILEDKNLKFIPVLREDKKNIQDARTFLIRNNAGNLPVYLDKKGYLFRSLNLYGYPTFILISKDGKILQQFVSLDELDETILDQILHDKE